MNFKQGESSSSAEKEKNFEKLLETPCTDFQKYIERACGLTVETIRQQATVMEVLVGEHESYVPEIILVMFLICCRDHLDVVLHPRQWEVEALKNFWEEQRTAVTVSQIICVLKSLRKTLRTAYSHSPVRCLVSTYRDFTGTSAKSLFRMDVLKLLDVLDKLNSFFANIRHNTSIYSPHTRTTFTSHTSTNTGTTVINALGTSDPQLSSDSRGLSLDGLLEERTSGQSTMPTSCDTFLHMLDASSELVTSSNFKDYFVDINIYRYVVIDFVMHHLNLIINENVYRKRYVFGSRAVKNSSFKSYGSVEACDRIYFLRGIEDHNSFKLIRSVLNSNTNNTFMALKSIVKDGRKYNYNYKTCLSHEIGSMINNHIFPCAFFPYTHMGYPYEPYTSYPTTCPKCNFVHDIYVTRRTVQSIKTMYPLLHIGNIYYILIHCNNVKTISP